MAALAETRYMPKGRLLPRVTEKRSFGAVLSFRAICCDWCASAGKCSAQEGEFAKVRETDTIHQCPDYKPKAVAL